MAVLEREVRDQGTEVRAIRIELDSLVGQLNDRLLPRIDERMDDTERDLAAVATSLIRTGRETAATTPGWSRPSGGSASCAPSSPSWSSAPACGATCSPPWPGSATTSTRCAPGWRCAPPSRRRRGRARPRAEHHRPPGLTAALPGRAETGRPGQWTHDSAARIPPARDTRFRQRQPGERPPDVLAALAEVNDGHQPAYGDDVVTARLREVVRRHFGTRAEVFPVFNGTGANVVSLQALSERWSSVVCPESSHINTDECGAAEKIAGLKLATVPTPDGKLTPEMVERHATGFGNIQRREPAVVSITQSTELGTVYTAQETAAVAAAAHERGLAVHMDGARIANAAASLGLPLRALTADAGVDVLSFGGTKNGLLLGEAVVVLNPDAVRGMAYLRKSSMQLASKMRYVSAQLVALLDGDLWLRNAEHANAMARRLEAAARAVPGVRITQAVQANTVFAILPGDVAGRLRKRFPFYTWDESTGEVRWVCSFDTTPDDVDAFAAALAEEASA